LRLHDADDEEEDADPDGDDDQPPAACPVCDYKTLRAAGVGDICILCGWEDDGPGGPDPRSVEEASGGVNKDYSLAEARRNFTSFLTMYRPSDAYLFMRATNDEVLFKRERVCIALEERDRGPDDMARWADFDRCWPLIAAERVTVAATMEAEAVKDQQEQREMEDLAASAIAARAAQMTVEAMVGDEPGASASAASAAGAKGKATKK
jgi:hypothetical protein